MLSLAFWTDFGYLSLVAALEHAILHCARFTVAGDSYLIYGTDTGRSGLVGVLLMFPIVLPMKYEFIRTKVCPPGYVASGSCKLFGLRRSKYGETPPKIFRCPLR